VPRNCVQSQDNKKKSHAGTRAPKLSTTIYSITRQQKKATYWSMHMLRTFHQTMSSDARQQKKASCSTPCTFNWPNIPSIAWAWQPFSWQFWHNSFIFRNVETLSPKNKFQRTTKLWKKIKENSGNFHFQSNIFKIKYYSTPECWTCQGTTVIIQWFIGSCMSILLKP